METAKKSILETQKMKTPDLSRLISTLSEKQDGPLPEPETRTCEKHGSYMSRPVPGYNGRVIWTPCEACLRDRDNTLSRLSIVKKPEFDTGIPRRFRSASFESFVTSAESERALFIARDYADNFAENKSAGRCMVFCGRPGTGKTHLAAAIMNQLSGAYRCLYSGMWWMTERIKGHMREREHLQKIRELNQPDLLVLDEIGVQWGSDAEKMLTYQIINSRYEAQLPAIIISNHGKSGLEQYMGEATVDRLTENGGTLIEFTWGSYRGKA